MTMLLKVLPKLLPLFALFFFSSLLFAENVLLRGNGAEPETLDIHKSSGVPEANIQRDLFEGLITENAKGELVPGVAKSWSVDESGKVWTFQLREDAKWSNGDAVTAQDFVFAMQRAVDPETASEYAFILWPLLNAKAINKEKTKEVAELGVTAVNDFELKMELENPTPFLTGLLSHHMAFPLHKASLEKHGKRWTRPENMVSNGAYQLAEWMPQSHILLKKNPHFHDAKNVSLDGVKYFPSEDQNAALKQFRAGELDVTADVPSSQIDWVKKNLPESFRNSAYIGTYYLAVNLEKAPFKDQLALRRALSLAINRDILTEKVTKGGEVPAMGWVPPGMNHYTAQTMQEASLPYKEQRAKAKALFAEAGYSKSKPLEVELLYNTSENHKKVAIAIAAMWKQALGVKTKLRNEEWKVYLNSRTQRQFEVIRAGWIGDYNDASNFLDLFRSDVGTMNPSSWANADYDALLQQAEKETDTKKRAELLQNAETILLADMPLIPIYHYTTQHLVSTKVTGWEDNVMDIHPTRFLQKD